MTASVAGLAGPYDGPSVATVYIRSSRDTQVRPRPSSHRRDR